MWLRLANIERDTISNATRYPNNRSLFTIQVQDKIFKMRKNPAYSGPINDRIIPETVAQEQDIADNAPATDIQNENQNL